MRPATVAILILANALLASAADSPAGVIRVAAKCRGADARTLDATVLGPLDRQIIGVEGITRVESEAWNDGTGTLTLFFHPEADLNLAEVLVQNRVNLALPKIPEPCRQGISVRKVPAGSPLFWLAVTTANPDWDEKELKKAALVYLKPYFSRISGVSDVRILDVEDLDMRVLLEPDSLRRQRLMVGDVINALRRQYDPVGAAGSLGGKDFEQYTVTASGKLSKPEEFGEVILRATPKGDIVRLKDVAKIGMFPTFRGFRRVDGKPAALIAVAAWPGKVTAEKLLKEDCVGSLPPGMQLEVVADRSVDRLVAVEVGFPPGHPLKFAEEKIAQATELLRKMPESPHTVALAEDRGTATIFVKASGRERPTAADVDKVLNRLSSVTIRVADVEPGEEAFPVRIALADPSEFKDPGEQGERRFLEAAERVLAKLVEDKDVVQPAAFPSGRAPKRIVDVNRDSCAMKGVELNDVFTTLQSALGGAHATDVYMYGMASKITVQMQPEFTRFPEGLGQLFVCNSYAEMIPLAAVTTIRKSDGFSAVVHVDGYRAIIISAAPASGKTPAEVAAKCVKLAREVLPREYHVKDLTVP